MSPAPRVQRIAEWLIRAACRRLPADVRAERCREWAAELPAILDDESIRPPLRRALRALSFCIGISSTARRLSRSSRARAQQSKSWQWRDGAMPRQPLDVASRAVLGFLVWLVVVVGIIAIARSIGQAPRWLLMAGLALAIAFDAFCLADIARAPQVRYLPKWAWALICLIQTPAGGIAYLSIGHVGRPRPAPPGGQTP